MSDGLTNDSFGNSQLSLFPDLGFESRSPDGKARTSSPTGSYSTSLDDASQSSKSNSPTHQRPTFNSGNSISPRSELPSEAASPTSASKSVETSLEEVIQSLSGPSIHSSRQAQPTPATRFLSATAAGLENVDTLGILTPTIRENSSTQEALDETVKLCAVDGELFGRTFFPKTLRQRSPDFHATIWSLINSTARLVNIQVFRGGGKTTLLRLFMAHRIAYGISHTILLVGKSEAHAVRSLSWIRRQIQYNLRFTQIFNLKPGEKWAGNEITVYHGVDEYPITIIGMGLSGSIRGVNVDDYRPDLIIVDDILDEENSATEEQREKSARLVFGGLVPSLTPRSEDESAKLVLLQTPQDEQDLSMKALQDPQWKSARFPIWTRETEDLSIMHQVSAWPARWPSVELQKDKANAIDTNVYATWAREHELRPIKSEFLAFRSEWREYWDELPKDGFNVIAIDPVPPPSEVAVKKGLQNNDYEAFVVLRIAKGGYYIVEAIQNRGHEPEWTIAKFLELCLRYNPRNIYVESVAYQRVLAWILRRAMDRQHRWWAVREVEHKIKKYTRILDAIHGPASNHRLFFPRSGAQDLIAQYEKYPDVAHDDLLDALATAITQATRHFWQDAEDEDDGGLTVLNPFGAARGTLLISGDAP